MGQEAAMALAPTLQKYLADQDVTYNVISHARTTSSLETVQTSHIPADCFAKGILLRDQQGYWLAVLPASRHVQLSDLRTNLGDRVALASEEEVAEVFPDCARGAIPPFSECYGLDVIVDSSIDQQPELYCEGGDHETLVHMSQAEFARLNRQARHGSFTSPN
jgi:Ala-tRNA(Pro) deacylase